MGQLKPTLRVKMRLALVLALLVGISANMAQPIEEEIGMPLTNDASDLAVADAVEEEVEEEEREVVTQEERSLALLAMVKDLIGAPSCNDYGCCSCSRQDRDGNPRTVGGSCRVKKPRRENDTCDRRRSYCKCSASTILRWCTGECVRD